MKATKVLSLLLTAAMLLAVFPLGVWAENAISDFEYTITDGQVTITGYNGEGGDVVIPSEIEGYPVTSIGEWAFASKRLIKSVSISDNVTTIKQHAFDYCTELQNIALPETLTNIEEFAFYDCCSLVDIFIPRNVTNIGECVFSYCHSLSSIIVDVNNLVYRSESNCLIETATNTIIRGSSYSTVPRGVTRIEDFAFCGNYSLENIVIPNSVTHIGEGAFFNCVYLTSITIPSSVVSMGEFVFDTCYYLTDIYCEAETRPETWDKNWRGYIMATVHWGYKPPVAHGDANGDGEVNGLDVTRLLQYLASTDPKTGVPEGEVPDGADCNGDGVIDGRDAVRLIRYLANYDPWTGKSGVELGK